MSTDNKSLPRIDIVIGLCLILAGIAALIQDTAEVIRFMPTGGVWYHVVFALAGVIVTLVTFAVLEVRSKRPASTALIMGVFGVVILSTSTFGSMFYGTLEKEQLVWIAQPYGEKPEVLEQEVLFARPNVERHEFVMREQTVRAGGELVTADRLHLYAEVEVMVTFSPDRFNGLAFAALRNQTNASPGEVRLNDAIAREVADNLWAAVRETAFWLTEEEMYTGRAVRTAGTYFRDHSWKTTFRTAGFDWDGMIRVVTLQPITPLG